MILVCGIPSESSLARIIDALERHDEPHTVINQRHVRELALALSIDDCGLGGRLTGPGYEIDLSRVTGVYLRFMDDRPAGAQRGARRLAGPCIESRLP